MSTLRAAALASLALWLCACGGGHGDDHSQADEPHTDEAHATEAHAPGPHGESLGLRLDGTERWQMDDHTRKMFAAMVARLEGRGAEELASRQLGRELDADLDALVQGCTMTGDAHRELHRFLGAYIPAVQELAAEGGEAPAREVRRLLALYPTYFE